MARITIFWNKLIHTLIFWVVSACVVYALFSGVMDRRLWLDAPASTLIERVERRRNDPSDAHADVIRLQRAQQTDLIGWHRLDASMAAERVLAGATTYLWGQARDAINTAGRDAW